MRSASQFSSKYVKVREEGAIISLVIVFALTDLRVSVIIS